MTIASLKSSQKTRAMREVLASIDVRTLIANQLCVDVKRVTDEAHFTDDLGADWLDRLIVIEDRFPNVVIMDEDVDQIEVVGDLIRHIEDVGGDDAPSSRRRSSDPQVKGRGLAYPASLGRFSSGGRASNWPRLWMPVGSVSAVSSADCCERERCVQRCLAFASLQLMKSLAVGRTIANMNPQAAIPQISGADA
jgi:acyl carrier protein